MEFRAPPGLGLHPNGPLVVFDDAVDDGQAQAAAAGESGEKRFEHALTFLRRQAASAVGDDQTQGRARTLGALDAQDAAVGHGRQGVADQVPDDLLELAGTAVEFGPVRLEIPLDGDALAQIPAHPQQGQRFPDHVARAETGEFLRPGGSQIEELFDGLRDAARFAQDDGHQLAGFAGRMELGLKDLDGAGDGGQGIADFVGDQGRHLARLGQPFLDLQLVLDLLQGLARPARVAAELSEEIGDAQEHRPGQEDGV